MIKALRSKFSKIEYINEKGRFLLFVLFLIFILFVAYYLFRFAYARYEMNSKLVANIDKALYIFDTDQTSFNLDPDGIIPRAEPYVYRFSVSNFTESKNSDVDISYKVIVRTTTNLPLTIQLYRNELPDDAGAVNLFTGCRDVQDADNAWYHIYESPAEYSLYYANETTDYYTLVIYFPAQYANDTTYVNSIENIEVTLDSKQMV